MTATDIWRRRNRLISWERLNSKKPPGIHEPKLPGDAGWDLEAMKDVTIPPMGSVDVPVNARVLLPEGFYADIRNRSSMARRGLYVDQNIIDTGYRGPLFVFIRNMQLPSLQTSIFNDKNFFDWEKHQVTIKAGERIAQLIFHEHTPVWAEEVPVGSIDPLGTTRGEGGFGSTGT